MKQAGLSKATLEISARVSFEVFLWNMNQLGHVWSTSEIVFNWNICKVQLSHPNYS